MIIARTSRTRLLKGSFKVLDNVVWEELGTRLCLVLPPHIKKALASLGKVSGPQVLAHVSDKDMMV